VCFISILTNNVYPCVFMYDICSQSSTTISFMNTADVIMSTISFVNTIDTAISTALVNKVGVFDWKLCVNITCARSSLSSKQSFPSRQCYGMLYTCKWQQMFYVSPPVGREILQLLWGPPLDPVRSHIDCGPHFDSLTMGDDV